MGLEADFTNYIQNRLAAVEIFSETQSTSNIELDGALKTASKNQTGKIGYPDHIALVEDFVLVMEDKSDRLKLILRDDGEISQSVDATTHYAINGALFYAHKILDATHYDKIFAFGNVGDRKHHIIKPVFIDGDKNIKELPEVDTFKNFTAENIEAYYRRMVLGEESAEEIELKKILAAQKHCMNTCATTDNLARTKSHLSSRRFCLHWRRKKISTLRNLPAIRLTPTAKKFSTTLKII